MVSLLGRLIPIITNLAIENPLISSMMGGIDVDGGIVEGFALLEF
jgi:hypothetical protein